MLRTVEIEDTLDERCNIAIGEVLDLLNEYLDDDPDADETPCLSNDLDYDGRVHEIVDSSVPIYTHEIESTWYLHSNELEQSYENHGFGDNPRENDGMVAIYCYIYDAVADWYEDNADDIFDDWYEAIHEDDEED